MKSFNISKNKLNDYSSNFNFELQMMELSKLSSKDIKNIISKIEIPQNLNFKDLEHPV